MRLPRSIIHGRESGQCGALIPKSYTIRADLDFTQRMLSQSKRPMKSFVSEFLGTYPQIRTGRFADA